ncbi:MAG: hypothetical protein NC396_02155 [Bacteroides sp.]|nr:hypothetical protein [Bacteroides sp.]MCM1084993.1 hypothetical protein [Bacteroides sp.]
MKKILYLLIGLLLPILASAQEKRVIKETFEEESSYWPDFKDKKFSGITEDGYYVLTAKKEACGVVAKLPVQTDRNFKVSFKLYVLFFSIKSGFGIVYDYKNEYDFKLIGLSENMAVDYHRYVPRQQRDEDEDPETAFRKFLFSSAVMTSGYASKKQAYVSEAGTINASRIVLKKGSKKEINVEIERKGAKLMVRVNGMDVTSRRVGEEDFISNKFGFFVANIGGGKVLLVDEVMVEQE